MRRNARLAFVAMLSLSLSACEWFTDFKRQPYVTTWEQDSILGVRGQPQQSVPRTGTAVAGFQVSYIAAPGQLDSIAALVTNPTPVAEGSLANGHRYFQLNCAVCHGDTGGGDGPAVKYGMPGISIISDVTKARSDGYLFGIIRNGRGLMPPYNRIEEMDRWDVVNYVRALQGQAGGAQVATGPLARPGVTGSMVPGSTRLGPNRSVEPTLPALIGTPGAPRQGLEKSVESAPQGAAQPAKPGAHE